MKLVVIGDIHAQSAKLWSMLDAAGVADASKRPTAPVLDGEVRIVLLGDLVHAKSRERYAELIGVKRYDEYDPAHLARAERVQIDFLRDVRAFQSAAPDGGVTILMGNHDFNAVQADQGPLRTDDVTHLEWKDGHGSGLPDPLSEWIRSWPYELEIDGLHFAHVGPLEEHNRYDNGFYLENRRRWIYEERDYLDGTPYRLGVYGHTPVRGGVNIASQGRAILLDTNGYQDEAVWLEIELHDERYRLKMRGLFFDEWVQR